MNNRRMGTMLGVAVGLWGCQGPVEERGAYVLLDRDAREAGFALTSVKLDNVGVLPVEVEAPSTLTLVARGKQVELSAEPDELVIVHGAAGALEHRALGSEIDRDIVRVRGTEAAARELASVLAGTVDRRADGTWELHATNALAESSRVRAPAGVLEILPGLAAGTALPTTTATRSTSSNGSAFAAGDVADGRLENAPTEPAAASRPERVIIAAEDLMPPAVTCDDPVTGTWMSHQYHPDIAQWIVFTAQIHRVEAGSDELVGEVHSEFWSGGVDERTVPACGAQGSFHGAVRMPASGVIHGDQVELRCLSLTIEKTGCDTAWCGGYLLDKFTGTASGAELRTVNNDGGNSIDDATDFRRIGCD